ncbi:hypothetical protein vseg_008257 [Gypsophila vaccaria]
MEINKKEVDHQDTELRLGLPGTNGSKCSNNKRSFGDIKQESTTSNARDCVTNVNTSPPKAQVVGWPPVRSYRKNCVQAIKKEEEIGNMYVKVSMDGAPYLRKIDMKLYTSYGHLLKALQHMFKIHVGEYIEKEGYKGGEYVATYEDKDGDWMLVGDVPWDMFFSSCKRLRIMKGSKGLSCLP